MLFTYVGSKKGSQPWFSRKDAIFSPIIFAKIDKNSDHNIGPCVPRKQASKQANKQTNVMTANSGKWHGRKVGRAVLVVPVLLTLCALAAFYRSQELLERSSFYSDKFTPPEELRFGDATDQSVVMAVILKGKRFEGMMSPDRISPD
jgi:hypothetical protein